MFNLHQLQTHTLDPTEHETSYNLPGLLKIELDSIFKMRVTFDFTFLCISQNRFETSSYTFLGLKPSLPTHF